MEVHHPHHPTHKKKWSEYIIEFVMLFAAVTLGFFAENVREHMSENEKKKELLHAVARDFETDLEQFKFHREYSLAKIKNCDSLIAINNGDQSNVDQKAFYRIFLNAVWWWHFNPNEKSRNEAESKGYFAEKENSELAYNISKFNFFKKDLIDTEQMEGDADKLLLAEAPNFTDHEIFNKQVRFPSIEIESKLGIKKIDKATANKINYAYSLLKVCSDIYIMNIDSMSVYAKKSIEIINKEYK
jgi:hypothetical protein